MAQVCVGWVGRSITVRVQGHERVAQGLDLILTQLSCNDVEGSLLEPDLNEIFAVIVALTSYSPQVSKTEQL